MKRWLTIFLLTASVLTGSFLLDSCHKSKFSRASTPINFVVPPGFPPPTYSFASNPLTEQGFLLGRKLFYDGRLSLDGNFPCSSCHQPIAAFTTFEHDRSHGYNHSHTLRNAPGVFNLAWYPVFRQDGSTQNLETIYQDHITSPTEMAETLPGVINKIKGDTAYKRMFTEAFGSDEVTADRMFKAITQFLINMVSANSKYDQVKRGAATFTFEEQSGYATFQAKCASCHSGELFTDFGFHNIGLPVDAALNDYGLMRVTHNPADSLKFRTPSLRNVAFTSYYMHDGRFTLTRDVLKHFNTGIVQSPTLDPLLTNGLPLTADEQNNLVAFMRTLSDSSFLNNPRYRQ